MTLLVFEVRGVFLFRYDGETPPEIARHCNEFHDRYEVPATDALDALPVEYELVEDLDRYRVRFRGDPPESVRQDALLIDEGPMTATVLCPDEQAVERAVEAGGERVEGDE